jgi:hypothetical protein
MNAQSHAESVLRTTSDRFSTHVVKNQAAL